MSYNLGLRFQRISTQERGKVCLSYIDGTSFTFGELNERSNQYVHWLIQNGVAKGDVIGILNNKSFNAFALMIGCIKLGAIYTNLDPFSPFVRLSKIIDRCSPKFIFSDLSERELEADLYQTYQDRLRLLRSEDLNIELDLLSQQDNICVESVCGTDPAYIMFTSGSTGFPKGAVMTHSNLISFLEWSIGVTQPRDNEVFTNVNPIYFDNSVFDFYTSIFSGSTLAPLTTDITKSPVKLVRAIDHLKCTIWFSVPSLLVYLLTTRVLNGANLTCVRLFIFGGEGFPKPKLKQLYDMYGANAQLLNVYGPTECTCICSEYFINSSDFDDLNSLAPLGKMTKNFYYHIVDESLKPADKGELLLGGPNVGCGYYNDSERTEKAFIQNPVHDKYRDIMYRTGDLVERDTRGLVHFRGRVDNQIKHMGYRIELEEIEAGLNTITDVKEAAVIYKRLGVGLGQIVAYIASDQSLDTRHVLTEIKKIVPDYMVPKKIEIVSSLPKNQNGKIDRNALRAL
ncbi:AMP-binding protein [uncultured Roseivirga sp.]|uniref:AMP-binding protein n=1 Tax=uncultured Roseivirga sp. TaxID=543088 RepID=UPI00258B2866|nr:AMP-binding protein [uncultured Roseivirga sp.]